MQIRFWRKYIFSRSHFWKVCAALLLLFVLSIIILAKASDCYNARVKNVFLLQKNGERRPIFLPFFEPSPVPGAEYQYSVEFEWHSKASTLLSIIPDDYLKSITVNGKLLPEDRYSGPGRSDYRNGLKVDFKQYLRNGKNEILFCIRDSGGAYGIDVKPLIQAPPFRIFALILPLLFIFIFGYLIIHRLNMKRPLIVWMRNIFISVNTGSIFACIMVLPFACYAFVQLCLRINYELSWPYTWDTTVYWAIGRGILNNITPWSGLFEIKPPGIFLLSAFSFAVFDSPVFTHWFQVFVLLLTAALPCIAYYLLSRYRSIPKFAFSIFAGLLLALYSAERSGEVQVESFGAAFACIAVLAMAIPNFEKHRILWTSLAVVGILGACGLKEPFIFAIFGVSLFVCKGISDWFKRFVIPLLFAGLLGIVLLLFFGWLDDYFGYLSLMSKTYMGGRGSPFLRALQFIRLYDDLNVFSWGLAVAVFSLLAIPFTLSKLKIDENKLFIKSICIGMAFLLGSFAVGLGGEYYNHHHVFILPLYMALVLFLLKNWDAKSPVAGKLGIMSLIFFMLASLNMPDLKLDQRKENLRNAAARAINAAAYLDAKMDMLEISRYVFIGSNGIQIYGWTKHSPAGPYFFQLGRFFNEIPEFKDSIIDNMRKADAIVVAGIDPHLEPQASEILSKEFTKDKVCWNGELYFRTSKLKEYGQEPIPDTDDEKEQDTLW